MKRLVTQFDDTRTKATVATPTCSSCCCCCCCVASILTTSSVTVMNVSDLARQNNIPSGKATGYTVLGFFAFPLAIALGIGSAFLLSIFSIGVMVIAWILLLKLLYKKVGLSEPSKVIGTTVGLGTVFFIAEFIGGGALILYGSGGVSDGGGSGPVVYLVLAIFLPFLLIPLLRKMTRPLLTGLSAAPQPLASTVSQAETPPVIDPPQSWPNNQNNEPQATDRDNQQP